MAVPYILNKFFQNFEGLDLRSSDLIRSKNASTGLSNVDFRETGALNKRKGYQYLVRGNQGSPGVIANGMAVWEDIDSSTGAVQEKLVGVGENLFQKSTDTFTLTYSGSGVATYNVKLNESSLVWEFILEVDGAAVSTQNLGDGTEASDMTISTLVTNLNAVTDFTCTGGTNVASEKAAFIPTVVTASVSSTGTDITCHYWNQATLPSGISSLFPLHWAKRTDTSFENMTFSQLNGVMYISNGYDRLSKYDGNRAYRVGLPQGQISGVAEDGCGSTFSTGEKYNYKLLYEYTDARENIVNGQMSDITTQTVSGASVDLDVTVYNIKESSGTVPNYGFNLDQAVVNGTQAGVNDITVDTGNPLQVGDFVYIADGVSGEVVKREVTASSDTEITISGAAVNVSDNDIISVVKISLYRTIDFSSSGVPGLYYLVSDLVNDSSADTQVYSDSTSDATLQTNVQLVDPIKSRGLPPTCKYMTSWRGQLVLAGNIESSDTVYYSDISSPEYFPPADQSFDIDRPVTGIFAQDNILYVFEKDRIHGVTGDFGTDNITVTLVSREGIGCAAHATLSEVEGRVFFLSRQGIYSIDQTDGLLHIGSNIDPRFQSDSTYAFKQAVAYNWVLEDKYMILLPILNQASGNAISSNETTSETYVFDYFRKAWLQWNNFNFMGGIAVFGEELHFVRRTTSGGVTPDSELIRVLSTNTEYDYADHTGVISWNYATHWESLNEPSVWKKFLRLKVHSIDSTLQSFETDAFELDVSLQHDFDPDTDIGEFVIDFSGGALGWGNSPWSNFGWGEARLIGSKNKLASKKVKAHRLKFSNTNLHENVLISGLELEIATPYRQMLKE